MKPIPEKVFLQVRDEFGEPLEERTWCEDKINPTDIVYIREDVVEKIMEECFEGALT